MATRRDPLLAALIGKLPPAGPWAPQDREAWLKLMRAAFDVVYGYGFEAARDVPAAASGEIIELPNPLAARGRWHVDRDGFVRAPDGSEAELERVPHATVLLDFRAGNAAPLTFADGTWPTAAVLQRGLGFEPAAEAA